MHIHDPTLNFNHTVEFACISGRDGQFRIIYYSKIVNRIQNPNPNSFFAINTINMKASITSLQQMHNKKKSLLQRNAFTLSTCLLVCAS